MTTMSIAPISHITPDNDVVTAGTRLTLTQIGVPDAAYAIIDPGSIEGRETLRGSVSP